MKAIVTAIFAAMLVASCFLQSNEAAPQQVNVAVAANFTPAAKDIAAAFEAETGQKAILSFGSTGKLYAQIAHGAPFGVFLAADARHPEMAERAGLAVAGTRFTYATGKIALYSPDPSLVDNSGAVLSRGGFEKLAIANPKNAPYGAAAVKAMTDLGVYDALLPKIVHGDNIAQTYQFLITGNAQLGFVALSQVVHDKTGSKWIVPEDIVTPIRQDAVLLTAGKNDSTALAFIAFLKSEKPREIMTRYGYGTD
ncbi:MAG: molybdate ABC transporter substrate-binding protein [Hyphomicrobiales bacterium]|nr:molybdate ABC transporter substrate-binding protein [Hyphomicrobiales bacterium]